MADKKNNNRKNRNNNGDDDFNPRFKKIRKKVCPLCADKNIILDYKNAEQIRKFVSDKGKILPRRATGACAIPRIPPPDKAIPNFIYNTQYILFTNYILFKHNKNGKSYNFKIQFKK